MLMVAALEVKPASGPQRWLLRRLTVRQGLR
jgi:hypothetical protein